MKKKPKNPPKFVLRGKVHLRETFGHLPKGSKIVSVELPPKPGVAELSAMSPEERLKAFQAMTFEERSQIAAQAMIEALNAQTKD